MRGETAVENGVEVGEHGGPAVPTTSVERRASIATLQNMLRKASHDSSHQHYSGGEWSVAAEMDSQPIGQNGNPADLIKTNPFHAHHKESPNKTNGTSLQAEVDPIFLLPSKLLDSPKDLGYGTKKTNNGAKLSQHLNVPQKYDPKDDLFRPSSLSIGVDANEDFQDSAQTDQFSKLVQRNGSDVVADGVDGLFGSSNKGTGLIRTPQTVASNPFHKTTASEADVFPSKDEELFYVKGTRGDTPTTDNDTPGRSFKENFDIFSSSSTNAIDPFPSPLQRSSLNVSSLDDPFSPTPIKQYNHLQNGSRSTKGDEDVFATPSRTTFSSPSNDSPFASVDLNKKMPPKLPPKPPNKPRDLLTTRQGPKEDILQPSPSSQTSSLSFSPSVSPADMNHVQTFKRPPRPLPRARRPKAEKPPTPDRPQPPVFPVRTEPEPEVPEQHVEAEVPKPPAKPVFNLLPKPVPPPKSKKPESKPLESENYVVFEDVVLIGQEHCVEDWPEDSPELDPDFKPSGKFKLRRESMKAKMESDGGSSEDPDGTFGHIKKKDKKLRMSLLSRRSSKEKFSDDMMEGKSNTLPLRKPPKEFGSNGHISIGDDEELYDLDYKKKPSKTTVNKLFRRASVASTAYEGKQMNGHLPQHSQDSDLDKKSSKRKSTIVRRQSEGSMLDERDYEEKGSSRQRSNSKVKIKFVPQRGFAISLEKPHDEPKGAYGYTPRKDSKGKSFEDSGAHGYTPRDKLQDEDFKELDEMEALSLHSAKAAIMEEEEQQRSQRYSPSLKGDYDVEATKDRKHKKSKRKVPLSRKSKSSYGTNEEASDDEMTKKDLKMLEEEVEDPDEIEMIKMKKHLKFKVPKKYKRKSKKAKKRSEAASDEHLSEAAKAAWQAAQMDEQAVAGAEEEEDEEEYDDEEQGDTDSLLEWWYTVEKWDELPSDEEDAALKEDESKSFANLAEKVERGLRLFNKVFTEQAEVLWEAIISLHALADDISEFHHKAKIAGISGGTTTAVGTVTAITGLALAPFTFGASLLVTAVGVGVATAGGITSASAAISDNVHSKNDRKKIEVLLQEYEDRLLEISNILHFVNQGLYRLRGHPFLRSGTQHYSQDWEVRKAVHMISIVDSPVMKATAITDDAVGSLQNLFKGMDNYFVKETREFKKSCKKEIVAEIRKVATELNDCIVELNTIREELQEATGQV